MVREFFKRNMPKLFGRLHQTGPKASLEINRHPEAAIAEVHGKVAVPHSSGVPMVLTPRSIGIDLTREEGLRPFLERVRENIPALRRLRGFGNINAHNFIMGNETSFNPRGGLVKVTISDKARSNARPGVYLGCTVFGKVLLIAEQGRQHIADFRSFGETKQFGDPIVPLEIPGRGEFYLSEPMMKRAVESGRAGTVYERESIRIEPTRLMYTMRDERGTLLSPLQMRDLFEYAAMDGLVDKYLTKHFGPDYRNHTEKWRT